MAIDDINRELQESISRYVSDFYKLGTPNYFHHNGKKSLVKNAKFLCAVR
jgi:hypothetical protein